MPWWHCAMKSQNNIHGNFSRNAMRNFKNCYRKSLECHEWKKKKCWKVLLFRKKFVHEFKKTFLNAFLCRPHSKHWQSSFQLIILRKEKKHFLNFSSCSMAIRSASMAIVMILSWVKFAFFSFTAHSTVPSWHSILFYWNRI